MSMCCIIIRKVNGTEYSAHDFAKSDRGAETVDLTKMLLLKASEVELPYDTGAALPGIDPEHSIPGKSNICSAMFVVLFAVAGTWSQASCPSLTVSRMNRKRFSSKEKYTPNILKKMRDSECLIISSEVNKSQQERYPRVRPHIQILACRGYMNSCQ